MKKVFFLSSVCFACVCLNNFTSVNANDLVVDASIKFRSSASFSCSKNMDFGIVRNEQSNDGKINIGTNNKLNAKGVEVSGGTPSAAELCIGADRNSTVEISCEKFGKARNGSKKPIKLEKIEISLNEKKEFGEGTPCAGMSKRVAVIDMNEKNIQSMFVGGEITLASASINANTPEFQHNPVTVQVIYQ